MFLSDLRVPVVQFDHSQYYILVDIGDPPQRFRMVVDSGSSDIWVPSVKASDDFCSKFNKYDCSASDTCIKRIFGKGFSSKIESMTVSGYYYVDDFTIGGLTVSEQTFAVINQVPPSLCLHGKYDGYLGIAENSKLFFHSIMQELHTIYAGYESSNVMVSFAMGRNSSKKNGEIILGEVQKGMLAGPLRFVDATDVGQWKVHLTGVKISGQTFCRRRCKARVSTGSPLIGVPFSVITQVVSAITGEFMSPRLYTGRPLVYFVDCQDCTTFSTVDFLIGNLTLTLTPKDYIMPANEAPYFGNTCFVGLVGVDESQWTLGNVLVSKYLTQFKFNKHAEIGFANLV